MNVVPSHWQDRKWVHRSRNKDMHNSFSIALGKLQLLRISVICYWIVTTSIGSAFSSLYLILWFLPLFFPCPDLSLPMPSLGSECSSLGRILPVSWLVSPDAVSRKWVSLSRSDSFYVLTCPSRCRLQDVSARSVDFLLYFDFVPSSCSGRKLPFNVVDFLRCFKFSSLSPFFRRWTLLFFLPASWVLTSLLLCNTAISRQTPHI